MAATTCTITFTSKDNSAAPQSFQCAADVYLLDAAEEAGFEWPYSGQSGTDSTSTARLVSGTVDQHDQAILSDEQTVRGYILTEVAWPRSDCVIVIAVEGELHSS